MMKVALLVHSGVTSCSFCFWDYNVLSICANLPDMTDIHIWVLFLGQIVYFLVSLWSSDKCCSFMLCSISMTLHLCVCL